MLEIEKAFNQFIFTLKLEAGQNKVILEHEDYQAFFANLTTLKVGFNNPYDEDVVNIFATYRQKLDNLNVLHNFQKSLHLFEVYHDLSKR